MKKKYKYLVNSSNGYKIVYDPYYSHAATHFRDKSDLKEIAKKALSEFNLDRDIIGTDIEFKNPVGLSDVVEVTDSDEIYFAMRTLREDQGYVQFTASRERQPSSFLSVHLEKIDKSAYELVSCWIGRYDNPPFPQMENATSDSKKFWKKHAFVEGSQEIIPGSRIEDCPW